MWPIWFTAACYKSKIILGSSCPVLLGMAAAKRENSSDPTHHKSLNELSLGTSVPGASSTKHTLRRGRR